MSAITANLKIMLLFTILTALLVAIGWALGGYVVSDYSWKGTFIIIIIMVIIAGVINVISYFLADRIVLWSYNVRIVSEKEQPKLYRIVQRIALKSNLPMPRVGIIPMNTPNAFATGRNPKNAVVCATEGLIDMMNDDELEGVMAHEMAHVKNRDILVMSVASTIAMAISFAARIMFWSSLGNRRNGNPLLLLVVAITVPIAAMLIQLAISRSREYYADSEGAKMIQKPWALANALEKLGYYSKKIPIQSGNPASASLFIVNPFSGGSFIALFSTHPPLQERIKRLREMQW